MHSNDYLLQMSLLFVEDDSIAREEMKTFLNRRIGKVITASDGIEGLEKFKVHNPDIVIADILMPKLDGISMMREIRSRGHKTPFIVTSTKSESKSILETVDLGIVKYVIKPIKLKELEACIQQIAEEKYNQDFDFKTLNYDEKKKLEFNIKKEISNFLKNTAGKGPRDVSAFIHDNKIDVIAYDTLTPMEQITIQNRESKNFVKKHRHIFYETVSDELEEIMTSLLGIPVRLHKIEINLPKNDKLIFELLYKQ